MDTNKRKLLSRIGAGLMLGLSLFNLGAAWSNQKNQEVPKKARQIRKREKEQVKPEVQMVADIAEQEGKAVIAEQQTVSQVQIQAESLTKLEQTIRFAAVSVWAISAGVFFSSMIFNFPFAMGKAVMSLLPGVPHTTVLSLETDKNYYEKDQLVKVTMKLDTDGDPVSLVKAVVKYDPNLLEFDRYQPIADGFESFNQQSISEGEFELILQNDQTAKVYEKENLAELYFHAKDISNENNNSKIEIDQEKSLVLQNHNSKSNNILGKTVAVRVKVIQPLVTPINCNRISFDAAKEQEWETYIKGKLLSSAVISSVELDQERALACLYNENQLFFAITQNLGDLATINISSNDEEIVASNKAINWQEANREFVVFPVDLVKVNQEKIKIQIKVQSQTGKEINWPVKGSGELVFQ